MSHISSPYPYKICVPVRTFALRKTRALQGLASDYPSRTAPWRNSGRSRRDAPLVTGTVSRISIGYGKNEPDFDGGSSGQFHEISHPYTFCSASPLRRRGGGGAPLLDPKSHPEGNPGPGYGGWREGTPSRSPNRWIAPTRTFGPGRGRSENSCHCTLRLQARKEQG